MTKLYCNSHKKENMINVKKKLCIITDCIKTPSYNYDSNDFKPEYCNAHKKESMINKNSINCIKCNIRASYNFRNLKNPIYCVKHKEKDMVNIRAENCIECNTRASFNYIGLKAIYCQTHKKENMLNVRTNICKQCNDIQSRNKNYDGYCIRCFVYLFPEKHVCKNYKIKENHVFDAIIKLLPDNTIYTRDKIVNGCSKRRPDLMIDIGSHWICAENDENCHKNYDNTCENKRLMELYTDMGNRPMIVIRFNCDKYKNNQSLFKINKQNGLEIIRSKKEFDLRISKFYEIINKYIISESPNKAITIEYLYYD